MTFSEKLLVALAVTLLSFTPVEKTEYTFRHPDYEKSAFTIKADLFKKFDAEWDGKNFSYRAAGRGFNCAVYYQKINAEQRKRFIDEVRSATSGPEISPMYALAYFTNERIEKADEYNNKNWGKPGDDFMFQQNDITVAGTPQIQKNMYAYVMIDKDLFANLHITKINCSSTDSLIMIDVLKSIRRIK